ncbi:MAG: DUF1127 domain-containing protein [Pseudomonadota bacterium]
MASHLSAPDLPPHPVGRVPHPFAGTARRVTLARLATMIVVWQQRMRARRRLAEMNDHALRDIGLTRDQAWEEAAKPFWR